MSERRRKNKSAPVDAATAKRLSALYRKLRWAGAIAWLLLCGAASIVGVPLTVLLLAGGVLVIAIMVFWASIQTLLGETPLAGADAYALGAPRAEEEQKRAVLRALKDLEFERSVGKISDEDYQELVARYRAEAKRLLKFLDADAAPRRAEVEAMVQKRLRKAGLAEAPSPTDAPGVDENGDATSDEEDGELPRSVPADDARSKKSGARATPEPTPADAQAERRCASCETINDADAVFCKKCGARCEGAPKEGALAKERG